MPSAYYNNKFDCSAHVTNHQSLEVDSEGLRKAFATYGDISDCRVMRDHLTNKSKGYGFVSFANSSDAQTAMQQG